jgi:hypothetical protein
MRKRSNALLTSSKVGISIELLVTASAGVWGIHGNYKSVCAQGFACVTPEDIALNENLAASAFVM